MWFEKPENVAGDYTAITFREYQSGWILVRGRYGDWVEAPAYTKYVDRGPIFFYDPYSGQSWELDPASADSYYEDRISERVVEPESIDLDEWFTTEDGTIICHDEIPF